MNGRLQIRAPRVWSMVNYRRLPHNGKTPPLRAGIVNRESCMAVTFNENSIAAETIAAGVTRQRLLTEARVKGTNILLDRLTLAAGAELALDVPAGNLAWFQILEGEAALAHAGGANELTQAHIVFVPPSFKGTLRTKTGATLLYAEVPDAARFDAGIRRSIRRRCAWSTGRANRCSIPSTTRASAFTSSRRNCSARAR